MAEDEEQHWCGLCAVDDPPTAEAACCHVEVLSEDGIETIDEDDLCQYHTDNFKSVEPMLGGLQVKVTELGP